MKFSFAFAGKFMLGMCVLNFQEVIDHVQNL